MHPKQIVKLLRIKGEAEHANKIAKAIVKYEKSQITSTQLNEYARGVWYIYTSHIIKSVNTAKQ